MGRERGWHAPEGKWIRSSGEMDGPGSLDERGGKRASKAEQGRHRRWDTEESASCEAVLGQIVVNRGVVLITLEELALNEVFDPLLEVLRVGGEPELREHL